MKARERIDVPGTVNFRDVGGYETIDGTVRPGSLFRSDGLAALGEAGRAKLRELSVRTVIDLRDDFEAELAPDDLDGAPVELVRLPLFEGSSASAGAAGVSLSRLYERILTTHSGVVAAAVRLIARADEGAVVVHCTAGKDRTGVVVAVALLAVGVDREQVVADYAESAANLRGPWFERMLALATGHGIPDTPQLRVLLGGSPPEALEEAIDLLEKEHGSARDYLLHAGLTVEELALLHARLVRVRQ